MREYLRAKGEADEYLQQSNLTYTIVRPGPLTNEGGTERIKTGTDLDRDAIEIPREDVARTLIATLGAESTYDETFELAAGEVSVGEELETPLQT